MGLRIETCITGPFEENCHLAWGAAKQAVVIDPGHGAATIAAVLQAHGLGVAAYVCTHGHCDHIGALAALHRRYPAPIALHSADLAWAFSETNKIEPYYAVPARPQVGEFLALEQSAEWTFADLRFTCIATPGHTPGSCCIYFESEKVVAAGDTLFKGTCGRTDLPGGDARLMRASLDRLRLLPDDVRVLCGHGEDTTIGYEKRTNFFMQ